jgi:hypothetical protein
MKLKSLLLVVGFIPAMIMAQGAPKIEAPIVVGAPSASTPAYAAASVLVRPTPAEPSSTAPKGSTLRNAAGDPVRVVHDIADLTLACLGNECIADGRERMTVDQAQAQKNAAASQAFSTKEPAITQGANQAQEVAQELRQSASGIAQDMRSMVNSTKAVSEEAQDNARSDLVPLPPPPPPDVPEKSANPDDVCGSVGRRVSVGGCTDL